MQKDGLIWIVKKKDESEVLSLAPSLMTMAASPTNTHRRTHIGKFQCSSVLVYESLEVQEGFALGNPPPSRRRAVAAFFIVIDRAPVV